MNLTPGAASARCTTCGNRLAWRNGADYCITCSSSKESTPPMTTTNTTLRLALGRAGEIYYVAVKIGQQRVNIDITAEQYAQLLTGNTLHLDVEVKS